MTGRGFASVLTPVVGRTAQVAAASPTTAATAAAVAYVMTRWRIN